MYVWVAGCSSRWSTIFTRLPSTNKRYIKLEMSESVLHGKTSPKMRKVRKAISDGLDSIQSYSAPFIHSFIHTTHSSYVRLIHLTLSSSGIHRTSVLLYGRFGLRATCAAQAKHVAPTMKVAPRPASLGLSISKASITRVKYDIKVY
jgi:hypothetical protein